MYAPRLALFSFRTCRLLLVGQASEAGGALHRCSILRDVFLKDVTTRLLLKAHRLLVSLGRDDNGARIKVWSCKDTDEGRRQPSLLRSLDCFPGKQDAAEIAQMAAHPAWPLLVYAIGLANGTILLLRADTGM